MSAGALPPRDLKPVARACGAFALLLGLVILTGWAIDAQLLVSIAPSLPAAMPNSALMFVACGIALAIEGGAFGRSRRAAAVGLGCKLLVVGIAGVTLVEHLSGTDLGIDNPYGIDHHTPDPGRPATHTAVSFMLLGLSLLSTRWRGPIPDAVAGVLSAGAAAVVGLAVAGYVIGVEHLLGTETAHGMAVHTAAGSVVVLIGVFALRPDAPPACWFARTGGGETAARRLMGPALVLPFLAGGLVQAGASVGLYGQRFALSIMVVVVAALMQALIYGAVGAVREYEAIEEALQRESRRNFERFATLTSEAPIGIFETNSEGKPVFLNPRWAEITGVPEAEALAGRTTLHPGDRERVQHDWRESMLAGRDYEAEFRYDNPERGVRWVAAHATPLRDEEGRVTGMLGSVLDITDRRAAEDRITLVVDRIAEAVSIIGPDGHRLHVNDAGRRLLDELSALNEGVAIADLTWSPVRADGSALPNADLPAEITRLTGREIDEELVGFPRANERVRWLRISTRRLNDDGPPYTVITSFADVTEQREADAQLAEAQKRFEQAFDHAPIGVALVSLDGTLLRVNEALCRMFDRDEDSLRGESFQELTEAEGIQDDLDQLGRVLSGEQRKYEMEKRYAKPDGSPVWALLSVSLVRDADERPRYFIAQVMDITERRQLERQLRHQADHDTLTGLANRRAFGTELGRQLARERRYGGESSLLMVDLDDFKGVNDSLGHAVGDFVLQAVANALAERVRDTDLVARLGGDEFAVLLPSTPREGAEVLAIDVVQALRELSVDAGEGRGVTITASVGLACSSELPEERDEDTLLAAADLAMYQAKRSGRDRYAAHRSSTL